jgi:hypothetical protein
MPSAAPPHHHPGAWRVAPAPVPAPAMDLLHQQLIAAGMARMDRPLTLVQLDPHPAREGGGPSGGSAAGGGDAGCSGRILYSNPAFAALVGRGDSLGAEGEGATLGVLFGQAGGSSEHAQRLRAAMQSALLSRAGPGAAPSTVTVLCQPCGARSFFNSITICPLDPPPGQPPCADPQRPQPPNTQPQPHPLHHASPPHQDAQAQAQAQAHLPAHLPAHHPAQHPQHPAHQPPGPAFLLLLHEDLGRGGGPASSPAGGGPGSAAPPATGGGWAPGGGAAGAGAGGGGGAGAEAEAEAADQGSRLRDAAFASCSEGITISDPQLPDAPLVYVNDAFLAMTG